MKMVSNWRQCWRWHSTQIMTAAAMFPLIWETLPTDVKAFIPDSWMPWVVAVMLVGGIIGRLRDQGAAQ